MERLSFRSKVCTSIVLQIVLLCFLPALILKHVPGYWDWIHDWADIPRHNVFQSPAKKKVIFLGTSYFGERYCSLLGPDEYHHSEDACALKNILNKKDTHGMEFFHLAAGATKPVVHLYFLMYLLTHNDGSIRYVVYGIPRKLSIKTEDDYHDGIHLALTKMIHTLPDNLRTPGLMAFSERLERFKQEHPAEQNAVLKNLTSNSYWQLEIGKKLWWLRALRSKLTYFAFLVMGKDYLQDQVDDLLLWEKNHSITLLNPGREFNRAHAFTNDADFIFVDLLADLCKASGVQLIFYEPPVYDLPGERELLANEIYGPVNRHFKNTKVQIFNYSDLPFNYPHDTLDGLHPTIFTKFKIADRMLSDLEKIENEKNKISPSQ